MAGINREETMWKPSRIALVLVSVSLLWPGRRAWAANANVNITDYMFTDTASGTSTTTINAGDSVTWNWPADQHSTTSGTCSGGGYTGGYGGGSSGSTCTADGNWDSSLNTAPHAFTQAFPVAGTFHYFCRVHLTAMTGVVIVNSVAPPPPPPPSVPSVCTPSATTLCLDDKADDKRFEVEATFQTTQNGGSSGNGQAIPLTTVGVTHGGLFWFFSADNPELLVKVLNACSFSGHIWIFASAGTNVGVTLTITDTHNGTQKVYTNPDLQEMIPIQDTSALSTCP
jgi:plastocyanin